MRRDSLPQHIRHVHDVEEVIRRYARAARELWKFCWSGGSGSHLVFVARTLELWADEADQVGWWKKRRGVAYTTNAIENLHSRMRQAVRAHGYFETKQSRTQLPLPRHPQPRPNGPQPAKWSNRWTAALNAFAITFEGRLEPS